MGEGTEGGWAGMGGIFVLVLFVKVACAAHWKGIAAAKAVDTIR